MRDPDTLQILSPAPVFDSGSSREKEYEKPEGILHTTVNGLYPTEMECLNQVKDLTGLDLERLPSKEMIRQELGKSSSLSQDRIRMLADLYEGKAAYLRKRYAKG